MQAGEGVQPVHQPFGMNPAQCMPANRELPGIIAQHDRVTPEVVCVDTAPDGALGGDPHRIGSRSEPMPRKAVSGLGRRGQCGEAQPLQVCRPGGLIGEGGFPPKRRGLGPKCPLVPSGRGATIVLPPGVNQRSRR